ncbi:putative protein phosphatase [Streptomyces venezuelae]|nr:putative protein phosphatase [Streptomyces venezuelae]CUM43694.1 Arsenate reductase [Streptomyces venezuelae]
MVDEAPSADAHHQGVLHDLRDTRADVDRQSSMPSRADLGWKLDDPAGQGVESVRPIRDAIRALVEGLVAEIDSTRRRRAESRRSAG